MKLAFLSLDVVGSTLLKHGAQAANIVETFNNFHEYVRKHISDNNGFVVSVSGDGVMAQFADSDLAVSCSFGIQGELTKFNSERNKLDFPFRIRIGISRGEMSFNKILTGKDAHPALDEAGKLQKDGISGNVMISHNVYNDLKKYKDYFTYLKHHEKIRADMFVNLPMPHWTSDILGNVSSMHYNTGYDHLNNEQYNKAEKEFRKALKEADKGENLQLVNSCLHGLGYALGRQRKNLQKIPYIQRQTDIATITGDQKMLIISHRNMYYAYYWYARELEREQNFSLAMKYYKKACDVAEKTGEHFLMNRVRVDFSDLKLYLKNHKKKRKTQA